MIGSQFRDSYFLISDPDSASSPPLIYVKQTTNNASSSPSLGDPASAKDFATSSNEYGLKHKATLPTPMRSAGNSGIPPLGLPNLKTALKFIQQRIERKKRVLNFCLG